MNIFTIFLFYKIVAKYTPERIKMHHLKIFSREHAPEPPSIQVASPCALHGTKRYANKLTFHKLINLNPTPPRNETLDMPFSQIMLVNSIFIHIININVFFCCCVRILIDRKKT